jgi:hypothetical protein
MGLFLRDEDVPRARPVKYNAHRTIVASAERINLRNPQAAQINKAFSEWQTAAWVGYKRVGEVHYGFGLLGSLLSRVRLFPAIVNDANESPTDLAALKDGSRLPAQLVSDAVTAMNELTEKDFSSFIRKFSLNMSVPGECYLVHMPDIDDDGRPVKRWMICSISEIVVTGSGATYTPRRGGPKRQLPPDTFIARMWRQDPEFSEDADSSMVGVADSVEELLLCQRLTRGAARSRMNAGVLFVPDGITTARTSSTGEPVLEEPGDDISGLAAMAQQDPGNDMVAQLMDAMVTPIGDEASAGGIVPMILVGPSDQGQAIRHVTFERATDEWLVRRAEVALDRILQGIDVPKEIVKGMSQVKYCMDSTTQALTRDGWKDYTDLAVGESILTLNPKTNLNEWQPVQAVNTFDCVDESMLSMEQRGHSSLSTMDHRWLVRRTTTLQGHRVYDQKFTTSRELSSGHFIPIAAPAAELPTEAKYSDAFVELIAWYWTEGWVSQLEAVHDSCTDRDGFRQVIDNARRDAGLTWSALGHRVGTYVSDNSANVSIRHILRAGGGTATTRQRLATALGIPVTDLHAFFVPRQPRQHIVITQSEKVNSPYVARIRACLTALAGPASPHPRGGGYTAWSEATTDLHQVTQFHLNDELVRAIQAICPGQDKVTSLDFVHSLTRAQLELFIETAIAADGWWRTSGEGVIHQKVDARLDALELACILSGRGVHRYSYPTKSGCVQHTLAIKKRTWVQPVRTNKPRVETTYTGVVWCPTVENHTWYAKRNGTVFCTANSNAVVIDENLYKANIEPLALVLADSLTSVYLRPVLKAQGYTDEQIKELVIWYDPSEIVTRPNSAESANQGVDRGLLSPSAWRREHGYAESDAPSEEEALWSMFVQSTSLPDNVVQAIAKKLFGKVLDIEEPVQPAQQAGQGQGLQVVKDPRGEQDPQRKAIQQVGVK